MEIIAFVIEEAEEKFLFPCCIHQVFSKLPLAHQSTFGDFLVFLPFFASIQASVQLFLEEQADKMYFSFVVFGCFICVLNYSARPVMKKTILLVTFFSLGIPLSAQVDKDSLWQVWSTPHIADTIRLKAIQDLAWSMMYSNVDSAYLLAQLELNFAVKQANSKWQGKALNTIGSTYNVKGNFAAALDHYLKGLTAMETAGDKKGIAAISNNIGLVYRNMGNNPKALEYYGKDLAIQEELRDANGLANAYNNLGTIYNGQGNYQKALEYYQKSTVEMEAVGDQAGLAMTCNNIGSIYFEQGDFPRALEYYRKSLVIREKLRDERGIALVYTNIGLVYNALKDYPQALEYYKKGIVVQEQLNDLPALIGSYYYAGLTFLDKKEYSTAIKWCSKGLEISRQIGSIRGERNYCDCLYSANKALGNDRQALAFHEEYMTLNDSLQKVETNVRLEQMEFARHVLADSLGKEEEKLKMQMAYQNVVRKKNKLNTVLFFSGGIVLALALGFWSRMLYFRRYSQLFQNKAEYLEKQQLLNEIALLKTQVNPHFLFNSLSILSSLVQVNPELSEQFIDQLSRSYRYILEQREQSLVTLRTELDFIQSYVFLLKIRFENKFDLRFNLSETILDEYKVAPLTLQLLVENAVKHNRMSLHEPLVVELLIEEEQYLVIKNRLQPRSTAADSTGLGLQNIINRYALLTDKPVWAGERQGDFVVKLPLI